MRSLPLCLALVCGFLTPVQAKRVDGQIFIVTAGAQAIKLPLVSVAAVSKANIEEHIKELDLKVAPERAKADASVTQLTAELEHDKRAEAIGLAKAKASVGMSSLSSDQKIVNQHLQFGRLTELQKRSKKTEERLGGALARRKSLRSVAAYFLDLPQPVATAKTDADGRFTLTLPDEGEYVMVASSTRAVFSQTENYYWMVRVDPQQSSITLSNDNLSISGSPESMLPIRE